MTSAPSLIFTLPNINIKPLHHIQYQKHEGNEKGKSAGKFKYH